MKNILTIFILVSFTSFQCCIKLANKCPAKFQIYSQILPYAEEYKIGDTLTIKSKFHKKVYEIQTNKYYNMEGINWSPKMSILQIDIDSVELIHKTKKYIDLVPDENYDFEWFTFSNGNTNLWGKFDYESDSFNIEIKIVLKETGIFALGFGSSLMQSKQDFPKKCQLTSFDVYTRANKEKDNNIHLLVESPNPHFNWILQKPEERFFQSGAYCYRVVE